MWDFYGAAFGDGIAHGHLAIAAECEFAVAAYGEDGGGANDWQWHGWNLCVLRVRRVGEVPLTAALRTR